ncbi:L-threonine aldolase [Breoghania corrubedonensis]|uniref:L-threonine aldolase n=1 Tax=Breoghania corrubedonensis TaxID=665038 RepID=A0A2T5V6U9_9HYPH|nr:low specificity L-threonine aldolase [Breoghania corrubedonensis]PTW59479.1 L-threonine aldolase [Breoghania corrubedonensis]
MFFASDNWAGASDTVMAALSSANDGFAPAYGEDDISRRVAARFNDIFEREVAVFFVATGSAANSLALAHSARPGGAIFCHDEAHVAVDECGCPEFMTGGSKLVRIKGAGGKIAPEGLAKALSGFQDGFVHHGRPQAVTITQSSEIGTVYTLDEIAAIKAVADTRALPLHMDGARFANALVSLGVTPAEMTWKAGVDLLSFGGTKNGCWCAEAVVIFDKDKADELAWLRKRAGQLFSKSRFIAAQFDGYLADDHWLDLARHSNAMAQKLADAVEASDNARLPARPEANETFIVVKKVRIPAMRDAGAAFYEWPADGLAPDQALRADEELIRLVTSFRTSEADIESFVALL